MAIFEENDASLEVDNGIALANEDMASEPIYEAGEAKRVTQIGIKTSGDESLIRFTPIGAYAENVVVEEATSTTPEVTLTDTLKRLDRYATAADPGYIRLGHGLASTQEGETYIDLPTINFADGTKYDPSTVTAEVTVNYDKVGAAKKDHASATTEFGVASTSNYGHVKLASAYTSTATDTVPTSKLLSDGLNAANANANKANSVIYFTIPGSTSASNITVNVNGTSVSNGASFGGWKVGSASVSPFAGTCEITFTGNAAGYITANSYPTIGLNTSASETAANAKSQKQHFGYINVVATAANKLTFYCKQANGSAFKVPSVNLPIVLKGF